MKDFILPDIGEGIVECELLKWLVKEGDTVVEDQPIAEVMTDKATVEIPAMHNGLIVKLYYQEGEIAKVHAPLFAMQADDDNTPIVTPSDMPTNIANASKQAVVNNAQSIEAFVLPDIGEGIVECEIMQWHISEGDTVIEDQVVVEVMTDKAVVEIPAKYNGKIIKLHYLKGDIAKVHTPLFDQLIGSQTSSGDTQESIVDAHVVSSANRSEHTDTAVVNSTTDNKLQGENFEAPVDVGRALASPAVRRLAREQNINLDTIQASGKKGRLLKQDVLNALQLNESDFEASQTSQSSQSQGTRPNNETAITQAQNKVQQQGVLSGTVLAGAQIAPMFENRVESIRGIRAAMAKQMMASVSTIPHFTVSDELCMDKLITLRQQLKPEFEQMGVKLSFMPFFIKALSLALQQYPIVNSRLNPEATELTYLSAHNIGLAVDSKIGLMVPNIKNVQHLSLLEIAKELNRIIVAAREGKLAKADLQDGSISISNIGAIGGITATPVINKPEVAIVALGKTQQLPRFDEHGNVHASNVLMVNWSGDHRVIDGATMVKFNNLWLDYLTHPERMLVHLR